MCVMHAHVFVYRGAHVCVCMNRGQSTPSVLLYHFLILLIWGLSSNLELVAHKYSAPPASVLYTLGLLNGFYVGAEDLNSGSHT